MKVRALRVGFLIAVASAVFAACAGSETTAPIGPIASASPSPSPTPTPTQTPSGPDKRSATFDLSKTHGPQSYPPVGQYTKVVYVIPPPSPAAGKLTVVVSVTKPSGLPTPSAIGVHPNAAASSTPIGYIQDTLFDTPQVMFDRVPSFSFTVQPGGQFPLPPYQVEEFDAARPGLGWQIVGPATLSGSTLVFNGPVKMFTLTHQVTVTFALVGSGTPPSGNVVIVPSSSLASPHPVVAGHSVSITASEQGYTGTFTATSSNTAIATVQPAAPNPSSGAFTVQGITPGSASITVTDTFGNSATFYVIVTPANQFTINLPAQQGQVVPFPSPIPVDNNYSSGNITWPSTNTYPAGTVITMTLTNAIPPGFFPAPGIPGTPVLTEKIVSNNSISGAALVNLPATTVTLSAPPSSFLCLAYAGIGQPWRVLEGVSGSNVFAFPSARNPTGAGIESQTPYALLLYVGGTSSCG